MMSLRALLARSELRLRLATVVDDERLDAPVTWVHSSDLPDPTPWLEAGQVLLTDGDYFQRPDADAGAYVARLRRRGVLALGFATGVLHDALPPALVAACAGHGLPLFEVDRHTAFMAIIRLVADDLARERRERLEWSLEAQRAIARAALRPDGLAAILAELEQRLDCWVALFDATGQPVPARTTRPVPRDLVGPLADQVGLMLSRGTRSAARVELAAGSGTLQSLGAPGRLGGVLAVGAATPLDEAGADLVTSVLALASVALEQSRALEEAQGRLRAGILDLALSHDVEVAAGVATRSGIPFPDGEVRVAVFPAGAAAPALEAEIVAGRRPAFAAAADGGTVVAIVPAAAADDTARVAGRYGVSAGLSAAIPRGEVAEGLAQARGALARTRRPAAPVARFDDLAAGGVLGLLETDDGRRHARALLAPIAGDRDLLAALATWLRHNGATDPAARELGIHRHSLTARVARAERALDLDLGGFDGRAELWTALRIAEPALLAG